MRNKYTFILLILISIPLSGLIWAVDTLSEINPTNTQEINPTNTQYKQKEILVDNFDEGETEGVFYERKNTIGHFQGAFSKRPSFTLLSKSEEHRRGDSGKGLVINYRKESGWCGWYTILGDLDVSEMNILSFWVKGDVGGERFDVGFSDVQRDKLEMDAAYAGPVTQYIGEVTTEWKEVKIPLSRVTTALDLAHLATIVFHCKYGGEGTLYIDDMKFTTDPEITKIEEANLPKGKKLDWYPRSMWVWKVDPVTNVKARKEVIKLCNLTATEIIYLYFGNFDQHRDPQYTQQLKELLKEAHENNLSVEVLTGDPTWAITENHDKAYNWLKPFLDFNQSQPKHLRIDGVSFDVEPYLAGEWKIDKEKLKKEYLVLLRRLRKLVDSYPEQKFKLGFAIPTFYINEDDFEEEILMLSDYVALMDYYDNAEDMIRNADKHLHLAKKLGKKVWIAVEIQDLVAMKQGARASTFYEEGWEYMEKELEKVKDQYSNHPAFGGFAMHCFYAYRQLQRDRTTPQNTLRLEKPKRDINDKDFTAGDIYSLYSFQRTSPVVVDGNLEDWNLDYPFELKEKRQIVYGSGATWKGPNDLGTSIYSMWDADTLYFAYKIDDNVIFQNEKGEKMWEGDHIELWLDVDLGTDFTEEVNSSDDFQIGLSPGNFNDLSPEAHIWVPRINTKYLNDIDIASAKTDKGYTIEVAIPKESLYNEETVPMSLTDVIESPGKSGRKIRYTQKRKGKPPKNFYKGYQLGIMSDSSDTDDANNLQKCLLSTSLNRKWGDPTVFGFLELKGKIEDEIANLPLRDGGGKIAYAQGDFEKEEVVTADDSFVSFMDTPELIMASDVYLYDIFSKEDEKKSSRMYRGKLGAYQIDPNIASTVYDDSVFFNPREDTIINAPPDFVIDKTDHQSIRIEYSNTREEKGFFCGSYVILMGDLSSYDTLTFLVKGEVGAEMFELGMNDAVSHKREDAVIVGSIRRFLPNGVTTEWQLVTIPLEDFYGPDLTKLFSLIFNFHEAGSGTFWIDEISLTGKKMVNREKEIEEKGYLLLDNFDHSDINLLGRKASTYKKLPSYIIKSRVENPRLGDEGRSLKLEYFKKNTGWTGYYTLLNQIDGEYYDLSNFSHVSFSVRGEKGGEDFQLGLADKNWIITGDSLKAGQVTEYLPEGKGITTGWQEVKIPLKDFGQLDFTEMGSFVFDFNILNDGIVYIDDIKFHLVEAENAKDK